MVVTTTAKPKAMNRNQFVSNLEDLINGSDMTQKELAQQLGYEQPNIITMFKVGSTRVPLEKVIELAKALGADPQQMLRDWFDAYMPGVNTMIDQYLVFPVSPAEKTWIAGLRGAFGKLPPFQMWMAGPLKKMMEKAP
jgi:predicted XRE-type DNA-binding protein